jgi:hypothetical protein
MPRGTWNELTMAYDPFKASGPGEGCEYPSSYWAATAGPEPEDDCWLNDEHPVRRIGQQAMCASINLDSH